MGYYDEIAEGYDRLHKEEQLKKIQIIKDNLPIYPEDKLLDVGCGTGFSLYCFGCDSTGIEPSKMMAGIGEAKGRKIIGGKAENLPFTDSFFDVVISVTAIHNFDDFKKGLIEMKRVGKKRFAFSILKKASAFQDIKKEIYSLFEVKNEIDEGKDVVYVVY